jgi:starch synthase (maltosyl-transferring)
LWALRKDLLAWKPAIVQTFLFHANILGRIASRWAGVPVVISGQRVAERRSSWYGRIDRWTNGLVDRNVCVSQGVADYCEHVVGLSAAKTVVIPNGVDLARFATSDAFDWTTLGLPSSARVLVNIGRLDPQKGVDDLLAAMCEVLPQAPECHLAIIGDGPDRASLEQKSQQAPLRDRVWFLGRRHDVPRLLNAAYALVLPSRWEGMPNVALEAMAAGKPLIATAVEGLSELVATDQTGWLVPPRQPEALAAAILEALRNPERAATFGRESQRIVNSSFTSSRMVASYEDLYRSLLPQGTSRAI